jgi:signal transduction histidine kinase
LEDPPTPLPLQADRRRMLLVLTELLGNAIDFPPNGGEIRLRAFAKSGVVEVHGGRVWAKSPGLRQGSVCTVVLPAAQ